MSDEWLCVRTGSDSDPIKAQTGNEVSTIRVSGWVKGSTPIQ
jgi:hypothetical protein